MSIKGTTQELFVGKTEVNIFTFMGNKINIPYSDVKRIDYCLAERFKMGFMTFIEKNNNVTKFDFGIKANDPISRTVIFINEHSPSTYIRECELNEFEKDTCVFIVPVFMQKELGLPLTGFPIHQKSTGEVYFNKDTRVFYSLLNYEWDGPEFDVVTKTTGNTTSSSQTKKKGKGLKIGVGALVGSIAGPVGTLVGAAVGAGSKGKSNTHGQTFTDSTETSKNVEKNTNGTITVRSHDNGMIYKISFKCNRDLDAKIRCLKFESEETKKEAVESVSMSLEGIKALKELLDMGAITQEEFDKKKQQILNI